MASVADDPASSASCGPLSAEEIAALAADFPHFEHAFVYGSALVAVTTAKLSVVDEDRPDEAGRYIEVDEGASRDFTTRNLKVLVGMELGYSTAEMKATAMVAAARMFAASQ